MKRGLLVLVWTLAARGLCAAEPPAVSPEGVELLNELPVSGPRVFLSPRCGFYYHPGAAWSLEGVVLSGGGAFEGGIAVAEGEAERGPRYGIACRFSAQAPAAFRFPVCAPAGGAALTFSIWEATPAGVRREVFRSARGLSEKLRVLPRHARLALFCGRWSQPLPARPDLPVAPLTGAQMPDADWMYENVDLVILGRGAWVEFSSESQAALRRWVLGGGALLIGAAGDSELLVQAVRASLLPVRPGLAALDNDALLAAAHWREADLQRDDKFQLIYARFHLGLGGGICFFPSADPAALARHGPGALAEPALLRERPALPDPRVWERPYGFFERDVRPPQRRQRVVLWAAVGGLCLLAALAFARTLRPRYLAAGVALGSAGLLSAFLARVFQPPEVVISRIVLTEVARDGRAAVRTEFAFLDGARDLAGLTVSGPVQGTLRQVCYDDQELRTSGTDLLGGDERARADQPAERGLSLRFRPAGSPPPPPLFQACEVRPSAGEGTPITLSVENKLKLRLPPGEWPVLRTDGPVGTAQVILVSPYSAPLPLSRTGSRYEVLHATSPAAALRAAEPALSEAALAARTEALKWALERAASRRRTMLFCFGTSPEVPPDPPLIGVSGLRSEEGPCVRMWLVGVTVH